MMVSTRHMAPELQDQFLALCAFSGQPPSDVITLCLELGVIEMWGHYGRNPKHAAQIERWERERRDKEASAEFGA